MPLALDGEPTAFDTAAALVVLVVTTCVHVHVHGSTFRNVTW